MVVLVFCVDIVVNDFLLSKEVVDPVSSKHLVLFLFLVTVIIGKLYSRPVANFENIGGMIPSYNIGYFDVTGPG